MLKKTPLVAVTIGILFVFSTLQVQASTQDQSLRERLNYSRAVESIIWSMPLMSYKAMRDGHKQDGGVGYNVVAYNSQVQDWRLQITTPNNTTPYVMAFWNVEDGPVVIEIPPTEEGVGHCCDYTRQNSIIWTNIRRI